MGKLKNCWENISKCYLLEGDYNGMAAQQSVGFEIKFYYKKQVYIITLFPIRIPDASKKA